MSRKKKQKREPMSEAEYIATFCNEKRIRDRKAVYVSPEVHKRLQKMFFTFSDYHITTMSLVDAILSHHFENNLELLTRLYNAKLDETLIFRRRYESESDFVDDESDEESPPCTIDGDDETVCP